ncbi:haloalkane dehalogenase [Kitasatospora sp. MAA19]|uniref:haloalkane dehalogenase n=1 Tax=Kitasatospora sp. MAA19 TaxID=3035090 RepID=UPI0024743A0F|nr:haloalkane dehalogenase [Kitasatospora sp. MAA19]MDH6709536.1 haloalkane dehalogenase [Kitasatospora sp. MAA19]
MANSYGVKPYGEKKTAVVKGRRMAYIEEGSGVPIVFQHGNPTSSYLWRNIMPHLEGLGRLVACDLIGMGDSEKLSPSGPERYSYVEQREYLFALWEQLGIDQDVVLVLHDWGSALGFDWANQHRGRVAGISYMESIVTPLVWDDWIVPARREAFEGLRSPAGEAMVLEDNFFVETHMPRGILRTLSSEEMARYIEPFATPGEDRRPTLTWPREVPIDGYPPNVVDIVHGYSNWLAQSDVPKLFINAEPGALLTGRPREFCRTWSNQTEVTVPGKHFVQEDSPDQIGEAIRRFVQGLRRP